MPFRPTHRSRSDAHARFRTACAASFLALSLLFAAAPTPAQSGVIDAQSDEVALCGSVDLVLALDTTYSLAKAIRELKRQAVEITDLLEEVSRGQFRVGLITFDDMVRVVEDLGDEPDSASKAERVRSAIRGLIAEGGKGGPEASDEALNTAINGLAQSGRNQIGNFRGAWTGHSRILVLITDNVPGGFDDTFAAGVDDRRFMGYAAEAAARGIRISTIYIPTSGMLLEPDEAIAGVLRGPPSVTSGLFVVTEWGGAGTAAGLMSILRSCGVNQLS